MPTCPQCGGSAAQILAPGFFECTSEVLRDAVPPGVHGNPSVIPLYGACGFRYQEGGSVQAAVPCECGMFSVGICAECGKHLCGRHGTHSGSRFVCVAHITEARDQTAAERHRRDQEELEAAKRAVQQERDAIAQAAPGFPASTATGPELAGVLARLVPSHIERFEAGSKSFGRTAYVSGWGFELWSTEDRDSRTGARHHGLVVTTDGGMYKSSWPVMNAWRTARTGAIDTVDQQILRYVLRQVLTWMGKSLPYASKAEHYLAATGRKITAPIDRSWQHWPE